MRVVLTGGGTGGHIYPAIALWRRMARELGQLDVLYIGSERGLERDIVPRQGLTFAAIPAAGLKRELSLAAVRTLVTTWRGYRQAHRLLRRFRPDVVVGTGGYVTLPVVFAASRRGIPSVVWEGNARPGLTNQLCARRAHSVAVSFPDSERWFPRARRVVVTGNPRASEVLDVSLDRVAAARREYGLDPERKLVVCFAGSRGAETVNEVVTELLPRFADRPQWQLLYVTGGAHYDDVEARVRRHADRVPGNVRLVPFVHDMPPVLRQADVVVTRAGSSTLAEICALGLAAVLIPSPYVTANHQEENAMRLAERGAALMIRERELSADRLWEVLTRVLDGGEGARLRQAAKALATPRAVDDLFELVMEAASASR
ncbi:undecaprenyldiphospho-muramoylpentapeptide beta-N-acetylglucosaminyltransferase [Alicyclobacillus macrosporangiidus]|uniref:UDP-N-acetylglucosamine--N-acetylmuramyl-(pentapeptide) pyrophosphoryl-undecaprenol N-acetylglucosamine transferase n=1 Tax=Alicyclobacillus macrosporangiidus TaxID=392015 RepID=A0A1I7HAV1_9BACL|nr:undecaprenyldiphospho-muramoylpentapeptide beta-N-acetylglucosaminyltransferase [Alicyclobacillus macrosporangiidus]SFU57719.1 UDP-N-acetylglucosamine--N-acetylmuramyl-(pentapeptide) pyrophosphoryl-undecaprenol N-acetylglucosamine transferase [Alicyclobacillus macrosporangiidus]